MHRIASLLKRWLLGTHQGSVDPDHLQAYLEEFTFRFNRRHATHRGLVFRRLLEQMVATGPVRQRELAFGYWPVEPETPQLADADTIRTLVVTPDQGSSRLVRNLDTDPRFTRIARAFTPHETSGQATGLDPQLVLIDGNRDDIIDTVTRARESGAGRAIVVHISRDTPATVDELTAAGADLCVRKPGRLNILDKAAELLEGRSAAT